MASTTTKGDATAVSSLAETVGIVCTLQQSMLRTESRLNKVEEASKVFAETHKLMVEKVDSIYKLSCNGILVNLAVTRNPHHHHKTPHHHYHSSLHHHCPTLSAEELAFRKK
jgi:hypothetical protein